MRFFIFILYLLLFDTLVAQKSNDRITNMSSDSVTYANLKKEKDSLNAVLLFYVNLRHISDSIKSLKIEISKNDSIIKIKSQRCDSLLKFIIHSDTTQLKKDVYLLSQRSDSIELILWLHKIGFFDNLSKSKLGDDFCQELTKFMFDFMPELHLYFFKSGNTVDLNTNKKKLTEIYDSIFTNSLDKYNFKFLLKSTFLSTKNNSEYKRYIDLILSLDISKCE